MMGISLIFQIFTPGPPGFFRPSIILPGGHLSKQLLKVAEFLKMRPFAGPGALNGPVDWPAW